MDIILNPSSRSDILPPLYSLANATCKEAREKFFEQLNIEDLDYIFYELNRDRRFESEKNKLKHLNNLVALVLELITYRKDMQDQDGRSTLHYLFQSLSDGILKDVIDKVAAVDIVETSGKTVFDYVIEKQSPELLQAFIERTGLQNIAPDKLKDTLISSLEKGHFEKAILLINHGITIDSAIINAVIAQRKEQEPLTIHQVATQSFLKFLRNKGISEKDLLILGQALHGPNFQAMTTETPDLVSATAESLSHAPSIAHVIGDSFIRKQRIGVGSSRETLEGNVPSRSIAFIRELLRNIGDDNFKDK